MTAIVTRATWIAIGCALIVLPILPIPRWTGAPDPGPPWSAHLVTWALGVPIVLAIALIIGRVTRTAGRVTHALRVPPWTTAFAIAAGLTTLAALAATSAFSRNPHLIDEVAQLLQAQTFASGAVVAPVPQPPEFFLIAQTLVTDAGWVSQYPPVHSLLLAIGLLGRAEWLVNPILGGVSTVLVFAVGRGLYGVRTALLAALLWATSAWVLFMSATYMNHVAAVTLALGSWAAIWGVHRATAWHVAIAGLLLAGTTATRPLDGLAAAMPVLAWVAWHRRWSSVAMLFLGGVPVALAWAFMNARMYGDPFTLGYTALYGPELGLGFGVDSWGRPFTPLTALSNMTVAVRRLYIHMFEWPVPALLPLGLWSLSRSRHSVRDFVLGIGLAAGPALYFFYWHSGFYPGPRFYYIAAPFLVIASARAFRWFWVRGRRRANSVVRLDVALVTLLLTVMVWGWVDLLPRRWSDYQAQLPTLKQHPERQLARMGVDRAVVLVPESWSSRVVTSLWGLGAPPGLVERAFNVGDTCELQQLATEARRVGLSASALADSLRRLLEAPPPDVRSLVDWPDPSVKIRVGSQPSEECRVELDRDRKGFTLYGNLAWRNAVGLASGVIFARDLYDRNAELLDQYGDWPMWRYAPPVGQPEALPVLTPLNRDVLRP